MTSGNAADILNGFYVVDHDGPEIIFTGGITAGAFGGIAVGPAQIGAQITGGIIADLELDLNDAAGSTGVQIADGRVHFNEFSDDPGCIFEATGEVSVEVLLDIILPPGADDIFEAIGDVLGDLIEEVQGFLDELGTSGRSSISCSIQRTPWEASSSQGLEEAGLLDGDITNIAKAIVLPPSNVVKDFLESGGTFTIIPKTKLFGFDLNDCDTAHADDPPALATLQADGTLLLNIGEDRAGFRNLEELETNEAYTITAVAPGVLRIDAFGISQTYGDKPGQPKVLTVVGNGQSGNDSVRVIGKTEQEGGEAITFNLTGGARR